MKLCEVQTGIARYHVTLTPAETKILLSSRRWARAISTSTRADGSLWSEAVLTKSQINQVCDELGINGREWFAQQGIVV